MSWILPPDQRVESPNISKGRAGVLLDTLVIHYAVDGDNSERGESDQQAFSATTPSVDAYDVARLFFRRTRGASAHFVVGRDGSMAQLCELDDTAWHAGGGALPDEGTGPLRKPRPWLMNRRSIGIELCNAGWAWERVGIPAEQTVKAAHPARPRKLRRWEAYPDRLMASLRHLASSIRPHFNEDGPVFVLGHEDVVNRDTLGKKYGGKVDPGPAFDWSAIRWREAGYTPIYYDYDRKRWEERPC